MKSAAFSLGTPSASAPHNGYSTWLGAENGPVRVRVVVYESVCVCVDVWVLGRVSVCE